MGCKKEGMLLCLWYFSYRLLFSLFFTGFGVFRAWCRKSIQAVEKGQKLGQIAFISKNLSMSEGLIKV